MQEIAKENIENVKTLYKMGKNVIVKYEQILMCKKLATLIWTPFLQIKSYCTSLHKVVHMQG